jgi:hypothetical protein
MVCLANYYEGRYYRQIAPRKGDASPFLNGLGDKRSEPRNALQPRAHTPHDFIPGFCSARPDTTVSPNIRKVRQPLGSEIRIDNGAAIQTSGDLRLVGTPAYRVFALPVRYACDGR